MRIGRLELVRLVEQAQRLVEFEEAIAASARAARARPPADAGSIIDFLEVPTGGAFDVAPAQAIAYFKAKGLKPRFSYADLLDEQHDHAFTVAKMMSVDMLGQVRASLDAALAGGQTFKEWADGITPILQSGGWWGRKEVVDQLSGQTVVAQLGSPWRLETIFRTNMQTAYAAGAWQEIDAQKDLAPYLMYDAVDDMRTRPLHASWDQKVLPVKSPWWSSHYPPNGYNCRCGVIQLSADEVEALGLTITRDPPDDGTVKWTNPRTGDVHHIPRGLDPGFEHNAGKSWKWTLQELLEQKIAGLQADMRQAAKNAKAATKAQVSEQLLAATGAQAEAAAAEAKAALARAKAVAEEKSKQWVAQQQLDLIAKGKDGGGAIAAFKVKALKQLVGTPAWTAATAAEKLELVLWNAGELKKAADAAKGIALFKKQVLAGKTPTPAAVKGFKTLAPDDAAALLKQLDDAKAAAAAKAAEEAAAAAAAATKAAPAPRIVVGKPPDPAKLAKVGAQRGSNPGGTYQDTDTGVLWYVKQPASADIAANEVLAAKLYELAGVEVPELHLITVDGRAAIASRIVDGLAKAEASKLAAASGTAEGFAVDAWLANWDVVGLGFDNLLLRGARAMRVDTGGALRYRAQGGLKGAAFGDKVTELESLRDASLNRQAADVFDRLTKQQIEDSVVTVLRVRDADIEAIVEQFGPAAALDRAALAERLIARKADLAKRYPAAAARARELEGAAAVPPKAPARVTAAEHDAVEASRVNGYGFATDSDQIEDNMVVVHAFKRADGSEATRGFFKLLPGASREWMQTIAAGAGEAPSVPLAGVRDAILAAVKSINYRADKGQALDVTTHGKIKAALGAVEAASRSLRAAAAKAKSGAPLLKKADELEAWRALLQPVLGEAQAGSKAKKLGRHFDTSAFPDSLAYDVATAPGAPAGLKWRRVAGRFEFNPSTFERSFATETKGRAVVDGVDLRYEAELSDGSKVVYFPHESQVAYAMQGTVKIDVPGRGVDTTSRVFGAMEEIGLKSVRASEVDRQHLYLNAFARIRLLRGPAAKYQAEFEAITDRGSEGVQKKLALLKKATGVDVQASDGWKTVDGVRQAFGHGRAYQLRPDLDDATLRDFGRVHVVYHNPKGLSTDAGAGVFDRLKTIIEGGGMFSSLTDRVRRGVPLSGSSVSADLASGGGDYHFTRIRVRSEQVGTGVYWRASVLRRMDAITYGGDNFGRTTPGHVEANRLGQTVDDFRRVSGTSSNETIFKGGLSIFDDVERIVLSSDAEVKEAIAWLRSKGYNSWPDGRRLEEIIVTKAKHRAKP